MKEKKSAMWRVKPSTVAVVDDLAAEAQADPVLCNEIGEIHTVKRDNSSKLYVVPISVIDRKGQLCFFSDRFWRFFSNKELGMSQCVVKGNARELRNNRILAALKYVGNIFFFQRAKG